MVKTCQDFLRSDPRAEKDHTLEVPGPNILWVEDQSSVKTVNLPPRGDAGQ